MATMTRMRCDITTTCSATLNIIFIAGSSKLMDSRLQVSAGFSVARFGTPPHHRVTQPSKTSSLIVEKEISGEMGFHESIVVQSFPTIFRFFKDKRPISLFPMRLPSLTLTDFKLSTT